MKRLHYIILSLIIGLAGTAMHFAHHVEVSDGARDFFCHFFPIGETCWEHMKMIFFPMLLLAVIMCIKRLQATKTSKHQDGSWYAVGSADKSPFFLEAIGGPMLSATITIPLAIGLYFLFHIIAPEAELIADVIVYWAEMFFAVWLALKLDKCDGIRRLWPLWIAVAVLWVVAFFVLTCHHPDWDLFRVPDDWLAIDPDGHGHSHHHSDI